ncbi:MAG: phospholipid carrier-dependent glycosyltransferase [Clostridia bacterium]|nr:phospholipid carrier-dependent glycosyltransferase [Clostridia bacterium]
MKRKLPNVRPSRSDRRLNKTDLFVMLAIMVAYAIFAFVNLGSLQFPTHAWKPAYGETAIVDLGGETTLSEIRFNGNIAEGTLYIYDDSDQYVEFEQDYGDMFDWKALKLSMTTQYVRLLVADGKIAFNEIALYDAAGNRIPATVYVQTDANGKDLFPGQQALLDEQNTVPENPSYLDGMYFDEIYHARSAYEIVTDDDLYFEGLSVGVTDFSYVKDNGYSIYEWTHPMLGKMLIAVGIRLFGMTPFGWRFTGTLFGVLMLGVLYVLAKRILRSTPYAALATGLFAVDCMHYTQTRIATIDVYALFFTLLMLLFMLDYLAANRKGEPFAKQMVPLGLCGLAFGLGAASKWTCLYTGAGLAVLFFGNFIVRCVEIIRERSNARIVINPVPMLPVLYAIGAFAVFFIAKVSNPSGGLLFRIKYDMEWYNLILSEAFWISMLMLTVLAIVSAFLFRLWCKGKTVDLRWNQQIMTLVLCCVFFIVIPALIYYASCYSFFLSENRTTLAEQLRCIHQKQISMYSYHANLDATHLCQSEWYQWPLAEKSVWFYYNSSPKGGVTNELISNISSTGNPAVWYAAAFGAVLMAVQWFLRKEYAKRPELWVVIVGVVSGLLAWRFVSRCVFLYHYFSAFPFVLLAAVYFLSELEKKHPQLKNVKWIWLGIAGAVFLLMYPAISGLPCSWGYAGFIEHVLAVFGKVYYVGV